MNNLRAKHLLIKQPRITLILLGLIMLVGLGLRLHSLSPYKFYPDSYQNLLIAQDIEQYHKPYGHLGPDGMLFPDFFAWTRFGYSSLIALIGHGTHYIGAAMAINVVASILSIAIAYKAISVIFTRRAGLIAAALLAISYNHVVRGGFVLTEPLSVMVVLCLIWLLFKYLYTLSKWADYQDIALGCLVAVAVAVRYEYLVILPITLLIVAYGSKTRLQKIVTISVSWFLTSLVLWAWAWSYFANVIKAHKLSALVFLLGTILFFCLLLVNPLRQFVAAKAHWITNLTTRYRPILYSLLVLLVAGLVFVGRHLDLSGTQAFLYNDFLISIFALIGLFTIWRSTHRQKVAAAFALICIIILAPLYYRVNPEMQRYATHLLPFLLIFAACGASYLLDRLAKINYRPVIIAAYSLAAVLLIGQTLVSYHGLRFKDKHIWYTKGYEEQSALKLKDKLPASALLIASMPEPYYYFTGYSTQSLSDTYPYIYIDDSLNNRTVTLVDDMGMDHFFPNFSNVIVGKLNQYKVSQYWVGTPFTHGFGVVSESHPVYVYQLNLGQLKNIVKQ